MSASPRFVAARGRCSAWLAAPAAVAAAVLFVLASCQGPNPAFQGAASPDPDAAVAEEPRDGGAADRGIVRADLGAGAALDGGVDGPLEPRFDAGSNDGVDAAAPPPTDAAPDLVGSGAEEAGALPPDAPPVDAAVASDAEVPAPIPTLDASFAVDVDAGPDPDAVADAAGDLDGGAPAGLRGEYFQGTSFDVPKLTRLDPTIDFDWRLEAPAAELSTEQFSVRWTGFLQPRFSETYSLGVASDDGVRLWIEDVLVIDEWHDRPTTLSVAQVALTAGRRYRIKLEYYEKTTLASVRLGWGSASQPQEVIPASALSPPP